MLNTGSRTRERIMKTDVKALWLTALRSGEYEQGSQRLRRADNTYCCLGVLCDIAVKAGVIPEPETPGFRDSYEYGVNSNTAFLPDEVARWADVDRFGQFTSNGQHFDLAQSNDDGATFETIANLIEKHL
jgi:hypothetical protein